MMLLKRLLLPGKGGMIICILILLNVLLWCGELGKEAIIFRNSNKTSTLSSYSTIIVITSLMYHSALSWCKYHGVALVTYYYIIMSLQFHKVYASEEVLVSLSKGPTLQPVFNKTDPLPMTLALNKGGEGGAIVIASQHNDYNYNKRRRRRRIPVNNNGSSNSSSVISSNSSNFLNHNNDSVLVNISWSARDGSGNSTRQDDENLRTVKFSSTNATMTDSLKLKKMARSAHTTLSSIAHLKRRKKGRTRNALHTSNISNNSNNQSDSTKGKKSRKPKLLKELTMFNRQNCLAKLLCGVQVAQPPTKSSSALNDYAYLVKAFFDRFSIRGIVTDVIDTAFAYEQDGLDVLDDGEEAEDEEDDDVSSEKRKKSSFVKIGNKIIGGAARHKAKRPHNNYHKYEPKYYEEYDKYLDDLEVDEFDDDIPDFMQPDILRRRMGKKFLHNVTECGNCTVVGVKLNRRRGIIPVDVNRIRRKRGMMGEVKRGFMGFFNPRFDKTAYLDKRQLEIESTDDKVRQLNIAEEIASRLRSPRQCRLLNWFGNNGNGDLKSANGMTTTITTITNTGGMIGNLDRLNGLQTGLPQNVNTGNGGMGTQGSQVVTVIQTGSSNAGAGAVLTTTPSSKTTVMLNNMGQSASNAMSQAKDVASHLGSTICPFNIQELQELILKAQGAPFPHFLTTPPSFPTRIVPADLGSQTQLPITSTSTTAETTTNIKAPSSTTASEIKGSGQSRNGFESPFSHGYDEFSDPHPTPPRYYARPTQHYLYDDEVTPPSPPHYHHQPTTPRHRLSHHRHNTTPRPLHKYNHHHTTPVYSSPVYPTPTYQSEYFDQRTREPVLIPPVGIAEVEDDFSDDDSYYSYQGSKGTSPYNQQKVHHTRIKKKPVPKWMTTTTPSPEDLNYYGYNDPVPKYSYGTKKQTGYKVQQSYKGPEDREQQGGYKVQRPVQNGAHKKPHYEHDEPEDVTFKIGPDLPRETTVNPTTDYIRQFHQPPVIVDSKKRYPPVGYQRQRPPSSPQFQQPSAPIRGKPPNQNGGGGQSRPRPQQNNKSEEDDDDDSESLDSSDESDESSSGETRTNLDPMKNPHELPNVPPTLPPPPPPPPREAPRSVEDEEEESNEALEKKEAGAESDDDDDEGESDEENESNDGNNAGKRSYERNDFSKDRGGPPAESTTTEKPDNSGTDEPISNSFFSGIFNSFGSLTSMFNRNNKGKSQNIGSSNIMTTTYQKSKPVAHNMPPHLPYATKVPNSIEVTSGQDESEESEENDDGENDSDEDDDDVQDEKKKAKPKTTTTTLKPKKIVTLKKKSRDPPMPFVNPNSHLQVFLRTTPVPVVIEGSSSWSVNKGHKDEGDDDDDDDEYNYNPAASFTSNVEKKNDNNQANNNKKNLYTGLGLSSDLSEFLTDLHLDLSPKKKKQKNKIENKKVVKKNSTAQSQSQEDDDNDADDDTSDESDEDNISSPPSRRGVPRPPLFMPPEPID